MTECSNGIEDKCVIKYIRNLVYFKYILVFFSMSIGGGVSAIFNAAVAEAYDSGVLSVVSSGNSYGIYKIFLFTLFHYIHCIYR